MKTMLRKTITLLLAVIMLVTLMPFAAFADSGDEFVLSVNPYGNEEGSIDTVKWFESESLGYYLFLPADCNRSALTVYFNGNEKVSVLGREIKSGETTDIFAHGSVFPVRHGSEVCMLTVMSSEKVSVRALNLFTGIFRIG